VQKDEEEDKVADLRKTFPPWVNFTNLLAQGVNASESEFAANIAI
jgi:hypothetical protein